MSKTNVWSLATSVECNGKSLCATTDSLPHHASFQDTGNFLSNSKNPCWYENQKEAVLMRCLPYFYVAGVCKCGTSDLYRRIRYHPDVMEGALKEYHWWDRLRYGAPMELRIYETSEKNDSELFPSFALAGMSFFSRPQYPVLWTVL